MIKKNSKNKAYLISLIEIALKYWIRSQCNSIEDIYINIKGDALKIINGNITGLAVKGNKIDFKNLLIKKISLESEEIILDIGINLKGVKAIPIKDFKINGYIVLSSNDLNTIFSTSNWSWIASWLCKNFSQDAIFKELKIENQGLVLKSFVESNESFQINYLLLNAKKGSISFTDKERSIEALLPMDKSICIEDIDLEESTLTIKGSSIVRP